MSLNAMTLFGNKHGPTTVLINAFRAATVGERGGIEIEVSATLVNGIYVLGYFCDTTNNAWLNRASSQLLTTAPATVTTGAVFGSDPTRVLTVRTGTTAAAAGGVFLNAAANRPQFFPLDQVPLWVPAPAWVSFSFDAANVAGTLGLMYAEVRK